MKKVKAAHVRLDEKFATAICGNDILSSTLYVSGIAIIFAGVYAPIVFLLVALVLYLYKSVYTEVVEALPVNGGAYNCLLNGTSKSLAANAGIMTLLSYVATAVISAKVAVEYLNSVIGHIPVIPATIVLLALFGLLVIGGIKDSARVALGIFIFHIVTLFGLLIMGAVFALNNNGFFIENLQHTTSILTNQGGLLKALLLGFAASLLGVSGFESSANFVEEQQRGVFRKTLRNMLLGVAFFSPLITLVVLNSLSFEAISHAKDFLLADTAYAVGGSIFKTILALDAFAVLSGAVLTSFVGVSGLMQRMAADACLPNFFSKQNKNGSFSRIIIFFFFLCTSILLVTNGELLSLAGMYTISFLGVMSLFAFGNMILHETRTELKRTYKAPRLFVVIAMLATTVGIVGNILIDPNNLLFFALYFIPCAVVVYGVMNQEMILKTIINRLPSDNALRRALEWKFKRVISGRYIIFLRNMHRLFPTIEYLVRNENNYNLTIVHCGKHERAQDDKGYQRLKTIIPALQDAGVHPYLKIDTLYKKASFGPEIIAQVSEELEVPKNRILIGSIHHSHNFDYDQLGGVRIIF